MTFEEYFAQIFGREAPDVVCFAQGAQFAVSRDTLRRVPRATYEQLLKWIDEEQRIEVVYYLVRAPHAASTPVLPHAAASAKSAPEASFLCRDRSLTAPSRGRNLHGRCCSARTTLATPFYATQTRASRHPRTGGGRVVS